MSNDMTIVIFYLLNNCIIKMEIVTECNRPDYKSGNDEK